MVAGDGFHRLIRLIPGGGPGWWWGVAGLLIAQDVTNENDSGLAGLGWGWWGTTR